MGIKVEARGKYPGVKVHLDREHCEILLALAADYKKAGNDKKQAAPSYFSLAVGIGKKIASLKEEMPNLLEERTEEQIHATLSKELIESQEKLAAIGKGADWTKIKVEVAK